MGPDRKKMKAKALHLASLLIALQCAVWVVFAPVIPQLHQAFADHNHIYCLQDHRIEDAGPRRVRPDAVAKPPSTQARVSTTRGDTVDVDLQPACAFSNLVVHLTEMTPARLSVPLPLQARKVQRATGVSVSALELTLLAPKHSPPLSF
jgi:hypothetical protein